MRIALLVGSTLHPLAGAAGVSERVHSSAGDFILAPVADKQIVRKVRAGNATALDRGNLLHSVSFSTTRIFDSAAEAWLWALDYDATFPREGILRLDALDATGVIHRRHLSAAVVAPPRRRVIGRSVLLDYQVDGSAITEVPVTLTITGTLTSDGSTPLVFAVMSQVANNIGGFMEWYGANGSLARQDEYEPWILQHDSSDAAWASSIGGASPELATGWTPLNTATGTPVITAS